jgi:nucleoside-diphosphate-sugar epimerase
MHGGRPLLGVWSHPGFEFIRADVRDRERVRSALEGIDAVVHLAAIVGDPACSKEPDLAREVNLEAAKHLIEDAERSRVGKFIFASTCSNYGKMTDPTRYIDEDGDLRPVSLYAETKVEVEQNLLAEDRSSRMGCTVLRFATLFGASPRMRFDLTVNEFTARLLIEKELMVYGEQFWRPYVHVGDAARAVSQVVAEEPAKIRGKVFNVGSTEQNFRKLDLVEMIRPLTPDATIEFVSKDEDPRDYRVSFDRIRQVLGFEISLTVEDGVREVADLVNSGVVENIDDPSYRN